MTNNQNPQIVGELITLFKLGEAIAPDYFKVTVRDGEVKSLWILDQCILIATRPLWPLELSDDFSGVVLSSVLQLLQRAGVQFSLQSAGEGCCAIAGSHVRQSSEPSIALLWAYLNWLELSADGVCCDRDTIAG